MPVMLVEQFYVIFLASVGNRTNPSIIKNLQVPLYVCQSLQKKAVPMRPRETLFPLRY